MDIKWVLVTLALNGQHDDAPSFSTASECAQVALKINSSIDQSRVAALIEMPAYINQQARVDSQVAVLDAFSDFTENHAGSDLGEGAKIKLLSLATELKGLGEAEKVAKMGCNRYADGTGKYQPITKACKAFEADRNNSQERLMKTDLTALPDSKVSCVPRVSD